MSEHAKALGALLIKISDMCDSAEAHGIVQNPQPGALGPLIKDADLLGIRFVAPPSLADLHMEVEAAAQRASASC
jgi:predicted carbohydrate-binding protein with CBM5 and CBM33 domain